MPYTTAGQKSRIIKDFAHWIDPEIIKKRYYIPKETFLHQSYLDYAVFRQVPSFGGIRESTTAQIALKTIDSANFCALTLNPGHLHGMRTILF